MASSGCSVARAKTKLIAASAYTGPETAKDAVHTEDPGMEKRIGASGAKTKTNHARISTLTAAKKIATRCGDKEPLAVARVLAFSSALAPLARAPIAA
jgi:hypothetical protein